MTYQNPQAQYTTTAQLRRIHVSCPAPGRVDAYTPQEARALEDHYISKMKEPQALERSLGEQRPEEKKPQCPRAKWGDWEVAKMVEMRANGATLVEIGKALGRTARAVRAKRRLVAPDVGVKADTIKDRVHSVLDDVNRVTASKICKQVGIAKISAYKALSTLKAQGLAHSVIHIDRSTGRPRKIALWCRGPEICPIARKILSEVADSANVRASDLIGRCQDQYISSPRQEAFYRIYHETNLSLPKIGELMGGRDHSTVLYGVRQHEARIGKQEA